MSTKRFLWIVLLGFMSTYAQKGELIFENDTIAIFESIVSKNSSENLYPFPYKNGLLYTSANNSDYYRLLFSNGIDKTKRIRISKRYQLGPVSIFKNEVYFTGMSRYMTAEGEPHLSIFRGELDEFKVNKAKELDFCIDGYTYAHANISEDGQSMVVVTNENDVYHLLELNRNDKNEWERGETVFITQLNFKILNPVYQGNDVMYFSSNVFDGNEGNKRYEQVGDKMVLVDIDKVDMSFNIYKIKRNKNGGWSIPMKVDALSSEFDDLGVCFINDKSGYLSTYRYDNTNNIFYFDLK